MAARIIELQKRREELRAQHAELIAAASKDKRNLSDEERTKADACEAEMTQVLATLKHEERQIEYAREGAPAAPPQDPADAPAPAASANPWGPTKTDSQFAHSFGSFLQAVAAAYKDGKVDPRLIDPQAAASGANTSVPSEGGVFVRTDFSMRLMERAVEESVLAQRCTTVEIGDGFDSLELPFIEETSRANGSRWGGVQVYRRAEAETVTATKPKFSSMEIRLEDMMGIYYATDRTLRDAVAVGQVAEKAFASEFAFKVDDEIIRGTGVGQCMGLIAHPATVTVAAEGSQVADTVVAENVIKMRARLRARNRANSIWLINQEVEPQLPQMVIKIKNVAGTENVGGAPIYMPANGLSVDGFDTLYGKPLVPIEQASAIGDLGDFWLVDLAEYLLIKQGGIQRAESMHVRFLYGENTFRFTYRVNGAPTWKAPLTPYKGASTLSPFVNLAAR